MSQLGSVFYFFSGSMRGSKFLNQVQLAWKSGGGGYFKTHWKKLHNLLYLGNVPNNLME